MTLAHTKNICLCVFAECVSACVIRLRGVGVRAPMPLCNVRPPLWQVDKLVFGQQTAPPGQTVHTHTPTFIDMFCQLRTHSVLRIGAAARFGQRYGWQWCVRVRVRNELIAMINGVVSRRYSQALVRFINPFISTAMDQRHTLHSTPFHFSTK